MDMAVCIKIKTKSVSMYECQQGFWNKYGYITNGRVKLKTKQGKFVFETFLKILVHFHKFAVDWAASNNEEDGIIE